MIRDFDSIEKLVESKAVSGLRHILMMEPNAPEVTAWSRVADRTWERSRVESLDPAMELASLGLSLPLAELYEGVEFASLRPRLTLP